MEKIALALASSLLSSSLLLAACGGSQPAPGSASSATVSSSSRATCEAIDEACDPHENEGGLAKECHDLSESKATTEETCIARKAECLKACPPIK